MGNAIKLSHPPTRSFWEVPVLFEDEHLLVLDKPCALAVTPDPDQPEQPSLMKLLHEGIAGGKPWAGERKVSYLADANRLDTEASGILVLAKSKPVLMALGDAFGMERPTRSFVALVRGTPAEERFEVDAKISAEPASPGFYRVTERSGKRAHTVFQVLEKFKGWTLLQCEPLTVRPHQIRAHLRYAKIPIAGDALYHGPPLLLSSLKGEYRLKPNRTERPLITQVALHADGLNLPHPVTAEALVVKAPLPKELEVALKYLRRYG